MAKGRDEVCGGVGVCALWDRTRFGLVLDEGRLVRYDLSSLIPLTAPFGCEDYISSNFFTDGFAILEDGKRDRIVCR